MLEASRTDYYIAQHTRCKDFDQNDSHFHVNYEIYYLIYGKRRYVVDNSIYDIEAGDIILIPPMVMHKTQRAPGVDEDHERFLFNVAEIPDILKPVFEKNFYRPNGEYKQKIKELIDESVNEKGTDEKNTFLHTLNLHKILLILSKMPKGKSVRHKLSERDKIIQTAAGYIKENCHKSLTLKEISNDFGFTPEYFSSIFKKAIGLGFVDYLNNMRVAMSFEFLVNTDMPISEISEKCGFNDSNYFTIVFRKVTGKSPTKYRKIMRK